MGCLDENTLLDFVEGRLAGQALGFADQHLSGCEDCRRLLGVLSQSVAGATATAKAATEPASAKDTVPADQRLLRGLTYGPALEPGTAVERYVVQECVATGGMGVVYRAFDPELNRKVALKLLRTDALLDPREGRARLLREAQVMARVTHPNVITVYDVGTFGEQVFIAMELVAEGTLASWLERGPRPPREVMDMFLQAGRGLAAAHAAGLVHRDFKPANVLVGADGRARVTDFGLARADVVSVVSGAPDSFATGVRAGTPGYMAPEQHAGRPIDARADQYSFCVALYEALYHRRPSASRPEVGEVSVSGAVPARVRRALKRGLSESPDHRFPSMLALLAELEPGQRGRWRLPLAATAGVVVLGAVGWLALGPTRNRPALCSGAAEKLAGIWDADQKRAIKAAFETRTQRNPGSAWTHARAAIDAYTERWVRMHTEACEATRLRGEQSEELLDLRIGCLNDRLREVAALTRALAVADDQVVSKSIDSAYSLPELEVCADNQALKSALRPPGTAKLRAAVEEVRRKLADVMVLYHMSKYQPGVERIGALVEESKALDYLPLQAEALYVRGLLSSGALDPKTAEDYFHRALAMAERARHDRIKVLSLLGLTYVVGYQLARFEEGHRFAQLAEASLDRVKGEKVFWGQLYYMRGAVDYLEGRFVEMVGEYRKAVAVFEKLPSQQSYYGRSLNNLAVAYEGQGHYREAQAEYRRARELLEKAYGKDHEQTVGVIENIAQTYLKLGELGEAEKYARRARELFEQNLKPGEPDPGAGTLRILGDICRLSGKHAEAESHYRRSLAIYEKLYGPEHPYVADALSGLGKLFFKTGDFAQSSTYLERAVRIRETKRSNPVDLADSRFAWAQTLWQVTAERPRARQLAERAQEAYDAANRHQELVEVQQWLLQRKAP